jgi:phosphatidylserine/phosphatidylglycerophosphate/cardiolipin synthase-like enzyme
LTDALFELAPFQRQRLSKALESGLVRSPVSAPMLESVLGNLDDVEAVRLAIQELEHLGIVGNGAAAWIQMSDAIEQRTAKPDLVWSGPEVPGVHSRDTRQVFEELLGSATTSLWACTYAFFDGPKAFQVLAKNMDANPSLSVTLLLNIQRGKGDTTSADQLVRKFTDRFWKVEWPGNARPRVFYDPRALEIDGPGAVLHAKAMVVDEERVLVTSANFTEAALDRNIELGLLVRDRAMAASIKAHFQGLVESGMLRLLPN